MKCEYCGAEESLPFVCNYCGGVFCGEHRLPEAHQCKGDLTQKRTIIAPPPPQPAPVNSSWSGGYTYNYPRSQGTGHKISRTEARDIIIAWLALGVAFSISVGGGALGVSSTLSGGTTYVLEYFAVMLTVVGSGFVLHELSHKFVAERYGYWAEFRIWPMGIVLALITSFIGFIFAAPGATYIAGNDISEYQNAIISLAGPMLNVVVAAIFLPVLLLGNGNTNGLLGLLGLLGVYINVFLGAFNMLPIMPLDGAKVWRWSKVRWAAVEIPLLIAVAAMLIVFFGV